MVDVTTEIIIRRPAAIVASFAMNPDNAPRWYSNIGSVEWQTSKPVRVGSRLRFVARFLMKRLAYTYEITELVPDRRLRMQTTEGPFPMETTYEFEPVTEAGCRVRLRNRGEPSGFAAFLTPFLSMAIRSANQKDLARLRTTVERA
jgi:uncharacterized membrane protein